MKTRLILPFSSAALALLIFAGCSVATNNSVDVNGSSSSIPSSEGFVHSGSASSDSSGRRQAYVTAGCLISGCSAQICGDATAGEVISTCEYRAAYDCYQKGRCEIQMDGHCGWTQTEELTTCIANAS